MQHLFYIATLLSAATAASHLVKEHLQDVPEGWLKVGIPASFRPLHFRIAMTQPNEALFEQTLLDISSPRNVRYGQHLKRDELKEMLRPSSEATTAVLSWLEYNGIRDIEENGEWINFVASTEQAEELLDTQFAVYRHESQNIGESQTLTLQICRMVT